jgi:hypothetical protein
VGAAVPLEEDAAELEKFGAEVVLAAGAVDTWSLQVQKFILLSTVIYVPKTGEGSPVNGDELRGIVVTGSCTDLLLCE